MPHAFFPTQFGNCGIAWNENGLTGFQLPEVSVALVAIILICFLLGFFFYEILGAVSPFDFAPFNWIPGWIWMGLKTFVVVTVFLWVRASFPRFRYDQIMRLGWKIFIPVTLVWLVVVGLWIQSPFNIWK